jgi:hypothetical protein
MMVYCHPGMVGNKGVEHRREGFKGSNKVDRQKRMSAHRNMAIPAGEEEFY